MTGARKIPITQEQIDERKLNIAIDEDMPGLGVSVYAEAVCFAPGRMPGIVQIEWHKFVVTPMQGFASSDRIEGIAKRYATESMTKQYWREITGKNEP